MSSVLFSILRTYFSNSSLFHPPAWGESRLLHRTPTEGLAEDWPRLSRNPENSSHCTWSHWAAVTHPREGEGKAANATCSDSHFPTRGSQGLLRWGWWLTTHIFLKFYLAILYSVHTHTHTLHFIISTLPFSCLPFPQTPPHPSPIYSLFLYKPESNQSRPWSVQNL